MPHRTTLTVVLVAGVLSRPAAVRAQAPPDEPDHARAERTSGHRDLPTVPVDWKRVMTASLTLVSFQHGARVAFQDWTRDELGGPFFRDWMRSVRMPKTWGDGDHWTANYLGHSIEGAAFGFIWIDSGGGARDARLGFSKAYWASRGRAAAWSAVYSLQFEFGPLSEASIGNVGRRPEKTGWVDHVVTPAGGFALMVAEDALDRYVIRRVDAATSNGFVRGVVRVALNPSRALSAVAQGHRPWDRGSRRPER